MPAVSNAAQCSDKRVQVLWRLRQENYWILEPRTLRSSGQYNITLSQNKKKIEKKAPSISYLLERVLGPRQSGPVLLQTLESK